PVSNWTRNSLEPRRKTAPAVLPARSLTGPWKTKNVGWYQAVKAAARATAVIVPTMTRRFFGAVGATAAVRSECMQLYNAGHLLYRMITWRSSSLAGTSLI